MTSDWKNYQESAAGFFRRLGLSAKVEHEIEGARSLHRIDVYVEGALHGISFRWVVECKDWSSNVSKEKVMALAAIVQDVGADHGFLLSETGFQSGAVRAAQKTNITLSSLEDITAAAEESFLDAALGGLHWRLHKARERLRDIKRAKFKDEYFPPSFESLAELMILEGALDDALKGEYPIIYSVNNGVRSSANSLDELLKAANAIVSKAEKWNPPVDT